MSHCPYLLHKFVINYLTTVCFIRVTNCSNLKVSQSFMGGGAAARFTPLPIPSVPTPMILIMIEMQYSGTALLLLVNPCILHRNNCIVHPNYVFIIWKGDALLSAMSITYLPQNWHFLWWPNMNGTQRRTLVISWRMHCMYSGMAKGTSGWATLNSEKIKPVALAIVELQESEGIRQAGRQLVNRKFC